MVPRRNGFENFQVQGTMYLDASQFDGPVSFDEALFFGTVYCRANPRRPVFGGKTLFTDAKFGGIAIFNDAQFLDEVDFGRASAASGFEFAGVQFTGPARFMYLSAPRLYCSVSLQAETSLLVPMLTSIVSESKAMPYSTQPSF